MCTIYNWDYNIPVAVVAAILGPLYILLAVIGMCTSGRTCTYLKDFSYGIAKATFRGSVSRKDQSTVTSTTSKQHIIFDYPVSPEVFISLGILCLLIWQSIFTIFWAVFLIDESFSCEENLDCFLFNLSNSAYTFNTLLSEMNLLKIAQSSTLWMLFQSNVLNSFSNMPKHLGQSEVFWCWLQLL